MLTVYISDQKKLRQESLADNIPPSPVWVDLLHPTREEEALIEKKLGLGVPTREEMQEIEISSRLYKENEALFMTATLLAGTDTEAPDASPVTFILSGHTLITIRYSEPKSFQAFSARALRSSGDYASGENILIGLMESIVDRLSDALERVALEINQVSEEVFKHKEGGKSHDFQDVLRRLGQRGDLNSKARESLVNLGRLLTFLGNTLDPSRTVSRDLKGRIKTLSQDIHALTDHASFLSNKINFLLDATLGMINIEQNSIIKIFSVAAVVFLPPTLIASIYGMNFHHMPELDWLAGYPFALGLMVLSAIMPYWYFKRRDWL